MPEKSGKDANHVPILDGRNFPLWSILIDVELSARGLRDICSSDLSPTSDPAVISNWNQLNIEAVQLILSRLHPEIIVTIVDGNTVKNAKMLWKKIHDKFASQTVTNRGRTWVRWECLRFNGNIKECSNILFNIAGIGISIPPDIMAYSILGKISRDSNAYDHAIDSMLLTMNSSINPQQVLDKLDGKHNPKNTTHKPKNCWAEHPELRPPPRNKNKRKLNEPETHQTGLQALLTNKELSDFSPSSLVIDCGATHHMFHNKNLFTTLTPNTDEKLPPVIQQAS
ncbi:hypothetical protein O181_082226 [Austropuccinia psidii MF-1]|uniref:Uncharacterized protein n=1 Tax=Austropuccinia psidii MF-1 TaxID=1389203 RepID=A0A9Q3FS70_9BASI|nr:hypothetical protein [Austropuccinia psidii MF-1]